MEPGWKKTPHGQGVSHRGSKADCRRPSVSDTGGQNFSEIRNADHSRSHYGNVSNVHNNHYYHPGMGQPQPDDTMLMESLAFKGMGDHLRTISPACADTCIWFTKTQAYMEWRDPAHRRSHHGILWIKGKPGTGKSTLMRYVYDYTRKKHRDEIAVSFFFHRRSLESLNKSTEGLYRSIIYQLYSQLPHLKAIAVQRSSNQAQHPWSVAVLEDMFREAILNLAPHEIVTCYIDALDECETDQIRSAIGYFEELSQSAVREGTNFSICFSSRYYPHITMQRHVEVKLDTMVEHSNDIRTYLDKKLTMPTSFRPELLADIEKRCSGIFLWVVLVVKMHKDGYDSGATRSRLRKILISVPDKLEELFESISESAEDAFHVAMRWVLFSTHSLDLRELYFAIMTGTGRMTSAHWDADEVDADTMLRYILHVSRGLIECTEEDSLYGRHVQFIHESVREHLFSRGTMKEERVLREKLEAQGHAKMAEDCQAYLRLCFDGQLSMPERFNKHGASARAFQEYPLGDYVRRNLFRHVESAYIGESIDLSSFVRFPVRDYIALSNYWHGTPNTNILHEDAATFLMLLIQERCYALVEVILQNIASSNQQSKRSRAFIKVHSQALKTLCGGMYGSPIHAAVHCGREELIQLLLSKGADPKLEGYVGFYENRRYYENPRLLAAKEGNVGVEKLLLDYGADPDLLSSSDTINALQRACMTRSLDTVELLLKRGARVDSHNVSHWSYDLTALHIAVKEDDWSGLIPMLRVLLDAGADVNARGGVDNDTALTFACRAKSPEVVMMLLDSGAYINHSSRSGTPLQVARKWKNKKVVALLVSRHAPDAQAQPSPDLASRHWEIVTKGFYICFGFSFFLSILVIAVYSWALILHAIIATVRLELWS